MSTLTDPSQVIPRSRKFDNGAEFLHSLGDIPPSRIIWNPPPGTATEKDLLALVEGANKRLCELVEGTLVEKPVGFDEGVIALNIGSAIKVFIKGRKLGVVTGGDGTIRMSEGNIRLPDVTFVSVMDFPGGKLPRVKVPTLPLTLAVEVISETNTKAEMRQKIQEYFVSGSKLVWLVYPKTKTIAVYSGPSDEPSRTLSGNDSLDADQLLPGFSMSLTDVFTISDIE